MANNSLLMRIESGYIFYDNFNTNENFYSFLLGQQGKSKQVILKRVSYHYSFGEYIKNDLPSFSIGEAKKLDLLSNRGRENFDKAFFKSKRRRGAKKSRGERQAISDRQNHLQCRERKSLHHRDRKKTPEIALKIEKSYRICRRFYQSLFVDVTDTFIQHINTLDLDEIEQ